MPFAVANRVSTYYEVKGEGPPLLLIAGNGMDHTTFRDQVPIFARHFRCITYDMRGIGQSDVPDDGYDIRTMAADALRLLDALEIREAHLAGYSLGGAIGLEMALAAPKRILTLSLYSSYSHVAPYLRQRYELLIKILEESTPEMWAMFSTFTAFGEEYINTHDAELEAEVKLRAQRWYGPNAPSKEGLLGHYRAILSHDVLDRLEKIKCPTWIAVGLCAADARAHRRFGTADLSRRAAPAAEFYDRLHRRRARFSAGAPPMSVAERVFGLIASDILSGALPPGSVISERALVERFGASRTPVREALKRLQERGLLATGPKGVSVVPPVSLDEIRQLYALRLRLERAAALLTARRITAEEIVRLRRINRRFAKVVERRDLIAMLEIRAEFHGVVVSAVRNRWLAEMLALLREKAYAVRHWHWQDLGRARDTIRLHDEMIAALAARDARRYSTLVVEQIRTALYAYSARLVAVPATERPGRRRGEPLNGIPIQDRLLLARGGPE